MTSSLSDIEYSLKEIGDRIFRLRNNNNLTREDLAELTNLSSKYIYELEKGLHACTIIVLVRLVQALNVSSDYILFGLEGKKVISPALQAILLNFSPSEQNQIFDIINSISKLSNIHCKTNGEHNE